MSTATMPQLYRNPQWQEEKHRRDEGGKFSTEDRRGDQQPEGGGSKPGPGFDSAELRAHAGYDDAHAHLAANDAEYGGLMQKALERWVNEGGHIEDLEEFQQAEGRIHGHLSSAQEGPQDEESEQEPQETPAQTQTGNGATGLQESDSATSIESLRQESLAQLESAPKSPVKQAMSSLLGSKSVRQTGTIEESFFDPDYAKRMYSHLEAHQRDGDGFGEVYDLSDFLGEGALGYHSPAGLLTVVPPMHKGDDWDVRFSVAGDVGAVGEEESQVAADEANSLPQNANELVAVESQDVAAQGEKNFHKRVEVDSVEVDSVEVTDDQPTDSSEPAPSEPADMSDEQLEQARQELHRQQSDAWAKGPSPDLDAIGKKKRQIDDEITQRKKATEAESTPAPSPEPPAPDSVPAPKVSEPAESDPEEPESEGNPTPKETEPKKVDRTGPGFNLRTGKVTTKLNTSPKLYDAIKDAIGDDNPAAFNAFRADVEDAWKLSAEEHAKRVEAVREITGRQGGRLGGYVQKVRAALERSDASTIKGFDEAVDYAENHFPWMLSDPHGTGNTDSEYNLAENIRLGMGPAPQKSDDAVIGMVLAKWGNPDYIGPDEDEDKAALASVTPEQLEAVPFRKSSEFRRRYAKWLGKSPGRKLRAMLYARQQGLWDTEKQGSLWDESKHPRAPKGSSETHPGAFVSKDSAEGSGEGGHGQPQSEEGRSIFDLPEFSEEQTAGLHEPWRMKQSEFVDMLNPRDSMREGFEQYHGQAVEEAILAGKDVPGEVLADYPHLSSETEGDESPSDEDGDQPENAGTGSLWAGDDDDTPREGAAKTTERMLDDDYAYARASSIRNAGEDLTGSARHKANAWKSLAESEKDGTAAEMVTKAQLLKNEPHALADRAEDNPMTALAMHLALKKFPAKPGYGARYNPDPEEAKRDRKQYYDAYVRLKEKAEEIAASESDPTEAVNLLREEVGATINELRGQEGTGYMAMATATDRYNPQANALTSMHKSLGRYRTGKTGVLKQLNEFSQHVAERYEGKEGEELAEASKRHALDMIEGANLAKTFSLSTNKSGPPKPTAADMYVLRAERVGGPKVTESNPNRVLGELIDHTGLRGVQWGNYVSDDERTHHSVKAAEAMADLTDILGLPPEAASLKGRLGLAIGARGRAGALAHYEPTHRVINLTRKGGAGALAHEWGHFFDNMIMDAVEDYGGKPHDRYGSEKLVSNQKMRRMAESGTMRVSDQAAFDRMHPAPPKHAQGVAAAFLDIDEAMSSSGYKKRLSETLRWHVGRKHMSGKKAREYWESGREMFARSFERHVQRKLEKGGRKNTYLSGIDDDLVHGRTGEEHLDKFGQLWPNNEEVDAMAPAFDKLFTEAKKAAESGAKLYWKAAT